MSAIEAPTLVASDIRVTRAGTSFTVEGAAVHIPLIGEHFVDPALEKLAAVVATGTPLTEAIATLELEASVDRWCMQSLSPREGLLVLNDAAEATPRSMSAALKTLAELALDGSRSVAVLGEMTDVGDDWRDEHDRIGRLVVRLNIAKLVVVGEGARHIHNAAGLEGSWDGESVLVATPDEAYDLVVEDFRFGDVVLVKSSAGAQLAQLGDRLGGVAA